jgi:hypothetical protein
MTHRVKLLWAAAGLVLLGCGVEASAPSTLGGGRFIIKGRVTNLAGANMLNVTVQVQPAGGGVALRTATTTSAGEYRITGLAEGLYRVAIVMGDSSRITSSGFKDTVYVGPSAESTIVQTLSYDPGRAISGQVRYQIRDTLRDLSVGIGGNMVYLALTATPTAFIDSIRTSATGNFRFAVRPANYTLTFDTTGFRARVDTAIADASITPTQGANVTASTNATSTFSANKTYPGPYEIRVQVFKDRSGDGLYRAVATDPDTLVGGVRFRLRKVGSTANIGTFVNTSGTSTAANGNLVITGLRNANDRYALHIQPWSLPTGCTLSSALTLTGEGDVQATSVLTGSTAGGALQVPLSCP